MEKFFLSIAAQKISRLNKIEKIWLGDHFSHQTLTQNITRRPVKVRLKHFDFGRNTMSTKLAQLIEKAAGKVSFCLSVEQSTFGFFPIFSLVHIPKGTGLNHEVIKWTNGLIPEEIQKRLLKKMYSRTNKFKRTLTGLGQLYELSHYEY